MVLFRLVVAPLPAYVEDPADTGDDEEHPAWDECPVRRDGSHEQADRGDGEHERPDGRGDVGFGVRSRNLRLTPAAGDDRTGSLHREDQVDTDDESASRSYVLHAYRAPVTRRNAPRPTAIRENRLTRGHLPPGACDRLQRAAARYRTR